MLSHVVVLANPQKPNIVFILSDDHALEAISAYGSWLKDHAKTPNIDRISKSGMTFHNMCVNNSICSPSRASILTGQYNHTNGVMKLHGKIKAGSPWLPKELQAFGYQNYLVGKWHLDSLPEGFEKFKIVDDQGEYFNPSFLDEQNQTVKTAGYSTDVYTDQALEWLSKHKSADPFMLMLNFKAPHYPYDYPERYESLLENSQIPEPLNLYEDLTKSSPMLKNRCFGQMAKARSYFRRQYKSTTPEMSKDGVDTWTGQVSAAYQHMSKKYIRCITAVDENVGRVLDYLEHNNLNDNTIVIYGSDQGYWLGQHGLYDKRLILDQSIKMPFIISYPKLIKNNKNFELCSNIDIAPTLLDLVGATPPSEMEGVSMLPLLKGEEVNDWRQAIWYNYTSNPNHYGIKTKEYTYVKFHESMDFEFYDNLKDPWQNKSEHKNPDYAAKIASAEVVLQRKLKELQLTESGVKKMGIKKNRKRNKQ
ncbi:mucin-desulfating sulfatase (N-acetylglucosamine-6-sulfatase) [Lentisphaera araneosa HTCC2155]|uniref:Mucin-desulfating sulfatase (N-acetylglucosamine-6-sulfatase) n=2 Tax=Lentisphaera TaxID=256846 RepID=A6DQC0_9BACT|nr:mucin-desulfating sulfatase (N-acetylglucosamine-6-sulfatase) [Lentisphaera araneosa HTCC2155]